MIEWITDFLIGIATLAIFLLLLAMYIRIQELCNEVSKRGKIARYICNILLTFIAICNIAGLIGGIIALFL